MSSKRAYKGGMRFPLCGANSIEEFMASVTYIGDLQHKALRTKIFKRPRKYTAELWLATLGELSYTVVNLSLPNQKVDRYELAQLIGHCAREYEKQHGMDTVSLERSFIQVKI